MKKGFLIGAKKKKKEATVASATAASPQHEAWRTDPLFQEIERQEAEDSQRPGDSQQFAATAASSTTAASTTVAPTKTALVPSAAASATAAPITAAPPTDSFPANKEDCDHVFRMLMTSFNEGRDLTEQEAVLPSER